MVMRSRATEGSSASKCEGKWPDQLLTHRFRLSTLRQRFVPPPALPERRKTAKIRTGSAVHMGNPGLDDRFHETTQLHLGLSMHGMRPFRASHMIRTLETLD
jgi:hypothetical protein